MAKKKNKGGRPRAITPEVVAKLIDGFHNDFTIEEACRNAGISKDTYYDELKRNPKFSDEMDRAQDYPFIMAKKNLLRAVKSGSASYSMSFLERRQRDRYAPKQITEHQGHVALTYEEVENQKPKAKSPEDARKIVGEQ